MIGYTASGLIPFTLSLCCILGCLVAYSQRVEDILRGGSKDTRTSSASMSIRRRMRSCCRSMRRSQIQALLRGPAHASKTSDIPDKLSAVSHERSSPRISSCRWGRVSIDGYGAVKDAKLYPGGARAWDWRETGTRHGPGIQPADVVELLDRGASVVVLSTGVFQRLRVRRKRWRCFSRRGSPCTSCRPARRLRPTICCARPTALVR